MFPPVAVTFDDGTSVVVVPKTRDTVIADRDGYSCWELPPTVKLYAVAYAALGRLARTGRLPAGIALPETFDAFVDAADCAEVT